MSKLLQIVQAAIKSSGRTHFDIATEAGLDRVRVTELANKKELRGTQNIEKVLEVLCPEAFSELKKACENSLDGTPRRT
jgi:hypothetical protein